jgi:hypothetical protein
MSMTQMMKLVAAAALAISLIFGALSMGKQLNKLENILIKLSFSKKNTIYTNKTGTSGDFHD